VALPFDFIDGGIAAGEPINCPSPAAAIQRAEGLWKVFGHAGSVAFSRTTDFEIGKFNDKHVLRRFGQNRRVSMTPVPYAVGAGERSPDGRRDGRGLEPASFESASRAALGGCAVVEAHMKEAAN
jgi:hypothetical protein